MTTFRFHEWVFDVDVPGTRRGYTENAKAHKELAAKHREEMEEAPELKSATCQRCLHYETAKKRGMVFPHQVSTLFENLGMTPLRESELLCDAREPVSGRFYYLAFYGFLGRMLEGRDAQKPRPGGWDPGYFEDLTADFSIGFTNDPFAGGPFDHNAPQVEAQVAVWLDWLLREPGNEHQNSTPA